MSNENEPEDDSDDVKSTTEKSKDYEHSCGASLTKGMEYCPACGDKVDSSAY